MHVYLRLLIVFLALLSGSAAWAQEPKGWLGADVQDVTKAEADKLGWDTPRGAKVGLVAPGSPAERAGLKAGDIIEIIDGMEVETSDALERSILDKRPGVEVQLRIRSGGRERRVAATLAERPKMRATEATAMPHLMLDTGGHMGLISALAFTPDGKLIVSASEDKVIRVWDWQAGKTLRNIRGQVSAGPPGKIYAMAISPDGRWLAAAGWLNKTEGESVRLYDFATGALVALLPGHTDAVLGLAFSRDGKLLISGGADSTANIWHVQDRKLVHSLKGHSAQVYGVGFSSDGARAVTGGYDKTLKIWSTVSGSAIATLKGHKQLVRALAISWASGMIASGDADGEIRLWDVRTGRYLRTLVNQKTVVGALSFSADGEYLISTCGQGVPCHDRVWRISNAEEVSRHKIDDNIVTAATTSPDGRSVATGGGNNQEIHVWDLKSGETRKALAGKGVPGWAVGFSIDGKRIGWGRSHFGRLEYQIRIPSPGDGGRLILSKPERITESGAFVQASTRRGELALAYHNGNSVILDVVGGDKVPVSIKRDSNDGWDHRCATFSPDGQTIISGASNGYLSAYDLDGKKIGEFIGHDGDLLAVAASVDGRLLISGSYDQAIRLWNLKTRELIVTLFHGTDGEWVMWTPQGYYTGSPGADKMVGWQINKGPENAADYVGAEQLRQHLNRPDIVEKAIILASAEQAVREAPGTSFQLGDLLARPVPRFKIVAPASGATERGGRTIVRIAVESTPDPIKSMRVQVNGRQVEEQTPDIGSGGFKPGEHILSVPLAAGRNEVRITLTNAIGEKAETVVLAHEGDGDLDKRGTLYILAIGVDKYPSLGKTCGANGNGSCDLSFSGADARALVDAVEMRLGPAHSNVVRRILVNGTGTGDDSTATNILDAIDLLKQAKETDTVLLFIAGHGFNDGPNYRFLATNAERLGETFRGATVVPWQILQEAIETAKGRRILFIDTCHSGNAYNQRLGNAAYHANIIAYTAARFDQEAMEDPKLGHGLFTYAVVEGLGGNGELGAKRQISTKELADYVVKRVDQLAKALKGEQEPQYFKGRDAEDYVLARW